MTATAEACPCGRPLVAFAGDLEATCGECRRTADWCECAPLAASNGHNRDMTPAEVVELPELVESEPLAALPDYPAGSLVGPLAGFVRWAERDGLHPALAAGAGLAALAVAAGPARAYVGSILAPPSLWVPLLGPASAGKSPALKHGFEAHAALELAERITYQEARAEWVRLVAAAGGDKAAKEAVGDPPDEPVSAVAGDATVEALARAMRDNGGSVGFVVDELDSFLSGLNQYRGGGGSDRAKLREMWTGTRPVDIKRVGDGGNRNAVSIWIARPALTVCGPLLPEDLPNLGSDTKGDRARWLPHAGTGKPKVREHPEDKPGDWTRVFGDLFACRGESRVWHVRGESFAVWRAARDRWDAATEDPDPEPVIQALRKADSQCARVALVLAESLDPGQSSGKDSIPVEAMRAAVAIVDYVIEVWRALPVANMMVTSRHEEVMDSMAGRFLAWLEARPAGVEGLPAGAAPRSRATRREIQQWAHLKASKLDALLLDHVERHGKGCLVGPVPNEQGRATFYVYAPARVAHNVTAKTSRLHNVAGRDIMPDGGLPAVIDSPTPREAPALNVAATLCAALAEVSERAGDDPAGLPSEPLDDPGGDPFDDPPADWLAALDDDQAAAAGDPGPDLSGDRPGSVPQPRRLLDFGPGVPGDYWLSGGTR